MYCIFISVSYKANTGCLDANPFNSRVEARRHHPDLLRPDIVHSEAGAQEGVCLTVLCRHRCRFVYFRGGPRPPQCSVRPPPNGRLGPPNESTQPPKNSNIKGQWTPVADLGRGKRGSSPPKRKVGGKHVFLPPPQKKKSKICGS